ncbi:MAG: phosphoribosyltransferase [Armatimonadota bacterium]|nr:phosphoribosyltransferase [bacterium]
MHRQAEPYFNRRQAGEELARALESYKDSDCIVLAIPRGGVVVASEIADRLGFDLDVIVPRKLRAPMQPELAIGAVASWGDHERMLDERTIRLLGVSQEYVDREAETQLTEINRRLLAYRGTTEPPSVAGRVAMLVDDGIATGYTMRAAAIAVRNLAAQHIILAVPVAPPDSLESLQPYVDEIVCLKTPTSFIAVGYWYRDFEQVSDDEVINLLHKARERELE